LKDSIIWLRIFNSPELLLLAPELGHGNGADLELTAPAAGGSAIRVAGQAPLEFKRALANLAGLDEACASAAGIGSISSR